MLTMQSDAHHEEPRPEHGCKSGNVCKLQKYLLKVPSKEKKGEAEEGSHTCRYARIQGSIFLCTSQLNEARCFSVGELKGTGYSLCELVDAGLTISELSEYKSLATVHAFKKEGFSALQLMDAGGGPGSMVGPFWFPPVSPGIGGRCGAGARVLVRADLRLTTSATKNEARPFDNAWVTVMYHESNDILKGIEKASDPSLKSSTQLPWNPGLDKKFLGV